MRTGDLGYYRPLGGPAAPSGAPASRLGGAGAWRGLGLLLVAALLSTAGLGCPTAPPPVVAPVAPVADPVVPAAGRAACVAAFPVGAPQPACFASVLMVQAYLAAGGATGGGGTIPPGTPLGDAFATVGTADDAALAILAPPPGVAAAPGGAAAAKAAFQAAIDAATGLETALPAQKATLDAALFYFRRALSWVPGTSTRQH